MQKIVVNTYSSIADIVRKHYNLPDTFSDDKVMSLHYHGLMKLPPLKITEVRRSSLLSACSPDIMNALDQLEQDALNGNLEKHLSKEAQKIGGKHDALLYRNAIWHFHIMPEPGRALHTSKHLIYGFIWGGILCLLDLGTHCKGEFDRDQHYLELVSKEWPEILPPEELAIINPPLGGGVEPNNESTLMVVTYGDIKRFAEHSDLILKDLASEIIKNLANQGIELQGDIYLDYSRLIRALKVGYHPSYAFCYQIRGTSFFVSCDLRDGRSETRFFSEQEMNDEFK